MAQFRKHYTREEARQLLPQIILWLDELMRLREETQRLDVEVSKALSGGEDVGGAPINDYVRGLVALKGILLCFREREIQIKDLDRGLVDFPAFIAGNEVFLCWERGEDDILYWHSLSSGYGGRERLA